VARAGAHCRAGGADEAEVSSSPPKASTTECCLASSAATRKRGRNVAINTRPVCQHGVAVSLRSMQLAMLIPRQWFTPFARLRRQPVRRAGRHRRTGFVRSCLGSRSPSSAGSVPGRLVDDRAAGQRWLSCFAHPGCSCSHQIRAQPSLIRRATTITRPLGLLHRAAWVNTSRPQQPEAPRPGRQILSLASSIGLLQQHLLKRPIGLMALQANGGSAATRGAADWTSSTAGPGLPTQPHHRREAPKLRPSGLSSRPWAVNPAANPPTCQRMRDAGRPAPRSCKQSRGLSPNMPAAAAKPIADQRRKAASAAPHHTTTHPPPTREMTDSADC